MNKITLVGNVVKDCEMSFVGSEGVAKARFTLACNERLGKDKEKVNFIPCVIWGKMAEGLADYILKGTKVAVNGRLDVDNVEVESDDWKTYVNVNVSELDFCSGQRKEETETKTTKKSNKTEKNRRR